jgi:hypothetical protein
LGGGRRGERKRRGGERGLGGEEMGMGWRKHWEEMGDRRRSEGWEGWVGERGEDGEEKRRR